MSDLSQCHECGHESLPVFNLEEEFFDYPMCLECILGRMAWMLLTIAKNADLDTTSGQFEKIEGKKPIRNGDHIKIVIDEDESDE